MLKRKEDLYYFDGFCNILGFLHVEGWEDFCVSMIQTSNVCRKNCDWIIWASCTKNCWYVFIYLFSILCSPLQYNTSILVA